MGRWPSTWGEWCTCWSKTRSIASASARRALSQLDGTILLLARRHGHTARVERAVGLFSRAGEHGACWFALGVCGAAVSAERRRWLRGLRLLAASYGINYAVKVAVRRPRPQLAGLPPLTPTVSRLSFPSAHATTSFAACRAFRGLLDDHGLLYGVAVMLGLSRPYLGVHYPSDVLAGAILGTIVGELWPG